jgi:hypothetical protein
MKAEDGSLKLGHSVAPAKRAKQLDRPVEIVHQTDVVEQAERIERLAHRILALHGRQIKGEWYEATLEDAIIAIEIATRQAENQELALGGKLLPHYVRKVPETTPCSIRIKTRTLLALQALADADDRSLSAYINRVLDQHVAQHGRVVDLARRRK